MVATAMAVAGACGTADDEPPAPAVPAADTSLADRAAAVVACLEAAGRTAAVKDTLPFGVEAPTVGVEAGPVPNQFGGEPGEVTVWLFEDAAAAEEWRPAITLSPEDTERTFLVGRVVVSYDIVPPDEERPVVEGCLEPPTG